MIIGTLKQLIDTIKGNFFTIIISFLILPLGLSLLMGKAQDDLFSGKIEIDPISITIEDKDKTEYSKSIVEIFKSKESEEFFRIEKEGDYLITILKGFKENLIQYNKIDVKIETKGNKPKLSEIETIKMYLESIGNNLITNEKNNKIINSVNNEELSKKLIYNLQEIQNGIEIENVKLKPNNNMTSNDYNAIVYLQFVMLNILVSSIMGAKKMSETTALDKRISILPVDSFKFSFISEMGNTILVFLISLIYIFSSKMINNSFKDNLVSYIFVALILSITVGIISLLMGNIKKEIAIVLVNGLFYLQFFIGGMFGPVEKVFSGTILEEISNINLNTIFVDPLMDVFNNTMSIKTFIPHTIIIAICLIITKILIDIQDKKKVGANI